MKLGEMIQHLRKEKGFSQEQFAEKINIGRSTLANYEQCKRDPNYETIELIANELEVSPAYLMGWIDTKGQLIGLKKSSSQFLTFNFDDDINFIKLDKYQLFISGIYNTYLDNQELYFNWFINTSANLEKYIAYLKDIDINSKKIYIPFFDMDFDYYSKLLNECISKLNSALINLDEMNECLADLKNDDIDNLAKNLSTKEKRDYLENYQNQYEFECLNDEEINNFFIKFMELNKQENKKFKEAIGVNKDITLL